MKVVLRTLFVTCICLFLVEEVSLIGMTLVGDVAINTQNDGMIYCDSLICPKGTTQCHVTKRNDPNDFQIIIRHRKCIGPNGVILEEQTLNEPNKYLSNVNVNVVSGGGTPARQLTPQEKKELDEYLKKTQERIESQVSGTLNQVYESLGPLLDGSFSTKLQNQINENLRNSLRF